MKRIKLLLLLLSSLSCFSQQKINFNDKIFTKTLNKWYDSKGFEVDSTIITLKFKDKKFESDVSKYGTSLKVNSLGYVDIKVFKNKPFSKTIKEMSDNKNILSIDINTIGTYNFIANDAQINNQWYLNTIQMPSAWDYTLGSNCISVAIIDSGVDWRHEDLGLGNNAYENTWTLML
jgi:serine protease